MLGSAAQNLVALSDSVFVFYLSETDFAAMGFVSVFYLLIASIGYGFSKGGQILIARRMGEGNHNEAGRTFYAMLYFELFLAVVMFLLMRFGCAHFFKWFIHSDIIYQKALQFIEYRSWGVFFSYAGVALIALYSGIARTSFITYDTMILGIANVILGYGLIFGKWGMPAMGIAGAGLASTLAEIIAFGVFVVYIFWDAPNRPFDLRKVKRLDLKLMYQQLNIGLPIVAQSVVGIGSWFLFFSIVEQLGERQLAITNLVRMVYLLLSVPCWGFSSGINTMVSHFIGQGKPRIVLPIIWKTARLCLGVTMVLAIPVAIFPQQILSKVLSGHASLIAEAQPVLYVLVAILATFSIGGVFFNGLAGTGATFFGLKMQFWCALLYLIYVYVAVNILQTSLEWVWAAEILYWVVMSGLTIWYLRSKKWLELKI